MVRSSWEWLEVVGNSWEWLGVVGRGDRRRTGGNGGWKGFETRQRLVSILEKNIKGFLAGEPVNIVGD